MNKIMDFEKWSAHRKKILILGGKIEDNFIRLSWEKGGNRFWREKSIIQGNPHHFFHLVSI